MRLAALLLMGSLLGTPVGSRGAEFAFVKIADTQTTVPGQTSVFAGFPQPPCLSRDEIVFCGTYPPGLSNPWKGIYRWSPAGVSRLADTQTPIPGGSAASRFNRVGMFPQIENGTIAFLGYDAGNGDGGIFRLTGGVFDLVAGKNTPRPGAAGTFVSPGDFQDPWLDSGRATFYWFLTSSVRGIYSDIPGTLGRVADETTIAPGATGGINWSIGPRFVVADVSSAFFQVKDHADEPAIFRWTSGNLERIADRTTLVPGAGTLRLAPLYSNYLADAESGRLAFVSTYLSGTSEPTGFFLWNAGSTSVIHRSGDILPEMYGAAGIYDAPCLDGPDLAFLARSCNSFSTCPRRSTAIYLEDADGPRFVVGNRDTLDGKPIKYLGMRPGALSQGRIAFWVQFEDGSQALYLASRVSDPQPASDGTIININAQLHGDGPLLDRLRLRVPSGTWRLSRLSPASDPPGQYWAWTPSMASQSWRTVFRYRSEDEVADGGCGYDPSAVVDPGSCETSAQDAYACTESQKPECFEFGPFTLDHEQVMEFWVGDNVLTDNGGGVSLLLRSASAASAPETVSGLAALGEPAPNPARNEIAMEFLTTRTGDARLMVYDLRGRLVRRLDLGTVSAGPHRAAWDGRDEKGQRVDSGIYFCSVALGRQHLGTRRVVMMR